jgi:uncharacterized membrane protein
MFGGSTKKDLKKNAMSSKELAVALAKDRKFRRQLRSAAGHGAKARRRAAPRAGMVAVAARVASDEKLRRELQEMGGNLQQAWQRVEKKRSHRLRNVLVALGLGAVAAKLFRSRGQVAQSLPGVGGTAPRTITEEIEVSVPVATAYNQWTQFEDFPLFMEGVEDVKQLEDTRLHWVASIGGKRAEWDAKILEQHPDRQVSWVSEDGKKTRGTVSFEERGSDKTLIRLSMSYQAEGPVELLGSAAGLDQRRVRSDLERFKELIESRGTESGAWRGEVSTGSKE